MIIIVSCGLTFDLSVPAFPWIRCSDPFFRLYVHMAAQRAVSKSRLPR